MSVFRVIQLALFLVAPWVLSPDARCHDDDRFLVGEFTVTRVVDGDTIGVDGLKSSIRFLCIDTEECEKGPGAEGKSRRLADGFELYARERVRADPLGQFKTPFGWDAKGFAEKWFPIGSSVRVEYDSLARKTGYYSRVLGYVFARQDGRWVNYNVECVRAGMSPYFNKYGKSLRFEAEFIAAEREARCNRRGIWSPFSMSYPNYDERLVAWSRRAACMDRFEEVYGDREAAISVLDDDDWARLAALVGSEVLLFGTARRVTDDPTTPLAELHHKEFARVAVNFSDRDVFEPVQDFLARHEEDFFHFTGVLEPGPTAPDGPFPYRLTVSESKQVYLELPESGWARSVPRKAVRFSGKRIHWRDALPYVGQEVGVVGRIVRTNVVGERTFLNFDRDYRKTLTLVIEKTHYDAFPSAPAALYDGRHVLVRGAVTEHRGSPQIVVTSPDQIEILE